MSNCNYMYMYTCTRVYTCTCMCAYIVHCTLYYAYYAYSSRLNHVLCTCVIVLILCCQGNIDFLSLVCNETQFPLSGRVVDNHIQTPLHLAARAKYNDRSTQVHTHTHAQYCTLSLYII